MKSSPRPGVGGVSEYTQLDFRKRSTLRSRPVALTAPCVTSFASSRTSGGRLAGTCR